MLAKTLLLTTVAFILIAFVAAQTPNGNITFAPPPPITSNILFNFINSTADSRLILSSKLESLTLEHGVNATTTLPFTNFTLNVFNRSAAGNLSHYQFIVPGAWNHVESSVETLSCSVVYQNTQQILGIVAFNRAAGIFRMLGAVPLANFTSFSVTLDQIREAIMIAEECTVMAFQNALTNQVAIYRASADWTEINVVVVPSNWNVQAATLDLMYGISNHKLYKYNKNLFQYDELYTFGPSTTYSIKNSQGRILVTSKNSTVVDPTAVPPVLSTNMKVHIFDDQLAGFVKIGQIPVTGAIEQASGSGQIVVFSSPQLTKFGFGYRTTAGGSITNLGAWHVDYTQNILVTLTFQDTARYFSTVKQIDPMRQLDFNEHFLVVRNGSSYDFNHPESPAIEEAYQFAGTQVAFLRSRGLTNNQTMFNGFSTGNATTDQQLFGFLKSFVDWNYQDKLVVLDLYMLNNSTYQLVQWNYGSLADNKRIIKPADSAYLTFTEPTFVWSSSLPHSFHWNYISRDTNTHFLEYRLSSSLPGHYALSSYTIPGTAGNIRFQNHKCKVLEVGLLPMYVLVKYNEATSSFENVGDLTQIVGDLLNSSKTSSPLTSAIITDTSQWTVSDECDRFRISQFFFIKDPTLPTFVGINKGSFTFSVASIDANITTVLSTDSKLYRISPSTASFNLLLTPEVPFPLGSNVRTAQNHLVVWSKNATQIRFFAFTLSSAGLTLCLNYSFVNFVQNTNVFLSPRLSKVIVFGQILLSNGSYAKKVDSFFIDYDKATFRNISFPLNSIRDLTQTFFTLTDQFFYAKQLNSTPVTTIYPQESVYFFKQDTIPVLVFNKNVTYYSGRSFEKALIFTVQDGKTYLFEEYVEGSSPSTRVLIATEVSGNQATLNNENSPSYFAQLVNGKVTICPPGCADCDCTGCLSGYVLDTSSQNCRPCPPGCLTCNQDDNKVCGSCITGAFLNLTTNLCDPCSSVCISCSGTANSCNICPPGEFKGASQCEQCPENCFNCTDAVTCVTCLKGFTKTSSNLCRKCSYSCSDCNPENITECTDCAPGLQPINGKCVPCPVNCRKCKDNVCGICIDGYNPNGNGVCTIKCQLPCLTCADNQPNYCLSCQSTSTPVNGRCQVDLSCNADDSCSDCQYGSNFVLVPSQTGANCQPCPEIGNCAQCDKVNNYKCSICKNGYYSLASGQCSICNTNCTSCKSSTICSGCVSGFTLMDGYTEGACLACQSPCVTCEGSPTYCTSCTGGFTRKNWKCRNNTYIGFSFVLNSDQATILASIDNIVLGILSIMGMNSSSIGAVTFDVIASGSTVATGTIQSTASTPLASTASTLITGLSGGIPGTNITVTGISVIPYYGTESESSESGSSSKAGLIAGVVVGVTIAVLVTVAVIVIIQRKKAQTVQPELGENAQNVQNVNKSGPIEDSKLQVDNKNATEQNFEFENV